MAFPVLCRPLFFGRHYIIQLIITVQPFGDSEGRFEHV